MFSICVSSSKYLQTPFSSKLTSFTLSGYLVCPNNSVTFSIWYPPSTNLSCMSCSYSSLLVSKSSVDLWLLHSSDLLLFFSSLTSTTKSIQPFFCLQSFLNLVNIFLNPSVISFHCSLGYKLHSVNRLRSLPNICSISVRISVNVCELSISINLH